MPYLGIVSPGILWNDVMKEEYKTSMIKRLPAYEKAFKKVETLKTWPEFESGYGDYISVCWMGGRNMQKSDERL